MIPSGFVQRLGGREGLAWSFAAGFWALLLTRRLMEAPGFVYWCAAAVCGILAAIWARREWRVRDRPLTRPQGLLVGCVAAYAIGLGISGIYGGVLDPGAIALCIAQVLVGLAGLAVAGHPPALTAVTVNLALGVAVASLYGGLEYLGYEPELLPRPDVPASDRVLSLFRNPNHYGGLVAGVLPVGVGRFLMARSWPRGVMWYAWLGGGCTSVLISGGRGPWLAMVAGTAIVFACFLMLKDQGSWRHRLARIGSVVLLMGVLSLTVGQEVSVATSEGEVVMLDRLSGTVDVATHVMEDGLSSTVGMATDGSVGYATVAHRYLIWHATCVALGEGLLVGSGPGSFKQRLARAQKALAARDEYEPWVVWLGLDSVTHAHNDFLELWVEGGVLAVVGLASLIAAAMFMTVRELPKCLGLDPSLLGVAGVVTAFSVHGLVSYPLHLALSGWVFWLYLGCLVYVGGPVGRGGGQGEVVQGAEEEKVGEIHEGVTTARSGRHTQGA